LNLTPEGPTARLMSLLGGEVSDRVGPVVPRSPTHLHRATPSFRPSRRSSPGTRSPRTPSIHCLTSLAAPGGYLSRRSLRRSLSSDVTEGMAGGCRQSGSSTVCRVGGTVGCVEARDRDSRATRGGSEHKSPQGSSGPISVGAVTNASASPITLVG